MLKGHKNRFLYRNGRLVIVNRLYYSDRIISLINTYNENKHEWVVARRSEYLVKA